MVDRRKEQSIIVAETKMFRWMSEMTRENRIMNEYVKGSIGVTSIVDQMREI